ncbi:MAG: DUF4304 domain-containing protein [Chloroflexi bacterium]|jgi:hypothetical protein|nr:DUF4304 domain-containing protein [Chloroflexota bacterium]
MIVKSPITEAIDHIVATGIHPVLKARGFKKRGRTFHRRASDLYHAVRVQASRHNEFDSGRFTINLGIASPEIAAVRLGGREVKNPAGQRNILLYARIGSLLPNQQDKWWPITPETDLSQLAREVGDALGRSKKISLPKAGSFPRKKHQVWEVLISGTTLASYGLAFFEHPAFQSTQALLDALESGALPVGLFGAPTIRDETHALLLHRAGRVDEAETVLVNLIQGKEDKRGLGRYVTRIRELGARLGFDL